jgi:hypothetical protein
MRSNHMLALGSLTLLATDCAAVPTSISHADLDVQTMVTNTVFLDRAAPDKHTLFLPQQL